MKLVMNRSHLYCAVLLIAILAANALAEKSQDALLFKHAYETYLNLVNAEDHAEKTQEIVNTAERAYEYGLKVYGKKSKNTALLAQNLALAHAHNWRSSLAWNVLLDAVPIFKSAYGRNSEELMYVYLDLVLYSGLGNKKALDFSKSADQIADKLYDSDSTEYAFFLIELGKHMSHTGYSDETIQILQKSLSIFNERKNTHMREIGIINFLIGERLYLDYSRQKSIPYLLSAYRIFNQLPDDNTEAIRKTAKKLFWSYYKLNDITNAQIYLLKMSELYAVNGNIKPSIVINCTPSRPDIAKEKNLRGVVEIQFTINKNGFTEDHTIISSTNSIFDNAALKTSKKCIYAPKLIDGKPVSQKLFIKTFNFKAKEDVDMTKILRAIEPSKFLRK